MGPDQERLTMGLGRWLKEKADQKSAENIRASLRKLNAAVRSDLATSSTGGDRSRTKAAVAAAHKDLFQSAGPFNSGSAVRAFAEIAFPYLESGDLGQRDFARAALLALTFTACQEAARLQNSDISDVLDETMRARLTEAGVPLR
jgi:hypothetical protein